eukprot:602188-Prymnesium_polylepis.1
MQSISNAEASQDATPAFSKPNWSHQSVRHASSRFHEMRSPTRDDLPSHVSMLFVAIEIALPS